jgi:predicted nucleotidyltransferase
MRVTREILLNLARENTAKFAAKDRGLVCVYLVGSLLRTDEPFLGGVDGY